MNKELGEIECIAGKSSERGINPIVPLIREKKAKALRVTPTIYPRNDEAFGNRLWRWCCGAQSVLPTPKLEMQI